MKTCTTRSPRWLCAAALTIACGEGALRIRSLQRPGKSAMAAEDMLRGYAVPKGTMLS